MTNLPPPGPGDAAHDVPPPPRGPGAHDVAGDVAGDAGGDGTDTTVRRDPADQRPVVLSSGRQQDRRPGRGPDRRAQAAREAAGAPVGPSSGRRRARTRWLGLAASAVAVAIAIAIAITVTSDESEDDAGPLADVPAGSTGSAPTTAVAPTTSGPADPATTTTAPVDPSVVEVGQAVRFTLPADYDRRAVGTGVEITNGRIRYYAQVANRPPGEDPLVAMQEYVAGFDALYASVAYTQVIPREVDTSGVAAADGYLVYYRVMAADGSGYKGVIDTTRRADGLVVVTDLYTALDDTSGETLPPSVPEQLYASFLQTPVVGSPAALQPLPVARLSSSKTAYVLDGLVAVMPPVGWSAETATPGRVVVTHPAGSRFVAARLPDTTDPLAAQDGAAAELQATWPGALLGPFTASRDTGAVASYDAAFTATAADGSAVAGIVRIWIDPARAQTFLAVSSTPTGAIAEPGHEAFLLAVLDISLTQPR